MTRGNAVDHTKWFTTTEMLDRGWARRWLEHLLGAPTKMGSAKLWARDRVLEMERHPVFIEARTELDNLAKRARYVTADHEEQALLRAHERWQSGEIAPPEKLDIEQPPDAAPSEWPKAEKSADALTLTWECGGKVVIPTPFLDALRRGLDETNERLAFAVNTVLTDWRCGRVKPERFASGRAWFLGWVRNTLIALQQMEAKRAFEPEPAPVGSDQTPQTLH
jgi:hypothetical protein